MWQVLLKHVERDDTMKVGMLLGTPNWNGFNHAARFHSPSILNFAKSCEMIEVLVRYGAKLDRDCEMDMGCLSRMNRSGRMDERWKIRDLLMVGADPNHRDEDGRFDWEDVTWKEFWVFANAEGFDWRLMDMSKPSHVSRCEQLMFRSSDSREQTVKDIFCYHACEQLLDQIRKRKYWDLSCGGKMMLGWFEEAYPIIIRTRCFNLLKEVLPTDLARYICEFI